MDFGNVAGSAGSCIENSTHACYGDRVNNTTDPNGYGTYGVGNGFTPNVIVDYTGPNHRLVAVQPQEGGGYAFGTSFHGSQYTITLSADAGFNVRLNSVTIKNTDIPNTPQTETFQVWADGTHLTSLDFTYDNAVDPTDFTFSLLAHSISIIADSAFVGIAALNFDQVAVAATPIPAALPLFASGLAGLGFARWRRNKKAAKAAKAA